jgi:exonuclease V gamma subunit
MKVFVSNQIPILADALYEQIFSDADAFCNKRTLVVPSEEVKNDLYLRWIDLKTEIVTGIKTITYKALVRSLFPELPSQIELALRLEAILEESQELKNYLKEGDHLRKGALSDQLSTLFLKYLKRPRDQLLKWKQEGGWQQDLWKAVFGEKLPTDTIKSVPGTFFFYHVSEIAPYEWDAFLRMETSWFLFSPSEMYLGDMRTSREQSYLLRQAKGPSKEELAGYFENDSPLLSNWGKQGRELLCFFEDVDTVDLFLPSQENSALCSLQNQWLMLENQTPAPPDLSLQLHSATSVLREVEIVWDIIQRLPFSPREIVVMAPQIQTYAAAIQWVFEERGGPFDYSIHGLEARRLSHLLQGLEILLSLPKYRFSKDFFEKLLLCPPFLSRFNLSAEEAEKISQWLSKVHLRYDLVSFAGSPAGSLAGSWPSALQRIIEAVVLSTSDFSLEFSDTSLISCLIDIVCKLQTALAPLLDQKKRTGDEWASFIEGCLETFFTSDEETDALSSILATLRNERVIGLFPYETIERLLQSALTRPVAVAHKNHLESIRFTSLNHGALTPAKAIICMGMQEGCFPRFDAPSSLSSLPTSSRIKEDEYLFLQAICHAQQMFIMTYLRCHP